MQVSENDVFVQKSYDVYRGFVQLRLVTHEPLPPPPPKMPGAAPPAAAPAAPAGEGGQPAGGEGAEGAGGAPDEPAPEFEVKMTKIAEILITFTKVSRLCRRSVLFDEFIAVQKRVRRCRVI